MITENCVAIARPEILSIYGSSYGLPRNTPRILIDSPPAGSIPSMLRSLTVNEDYFERRNLRIVCTQNSSWEHFLPQANEIIPRLYLTDMYTATNPLTLERLGISHVVSVVSRPWYTYPSHVRQLCLPVHDQTKSSIDMYLDSSIKWIKSALEEENARVMVHCMWGMSRSASIVIAYLMATRGMSLSHSMLHVKAKRSVVQPNVGFLEQLVSYEEKLRQRKRMQVFMDANIKAMCQCQRQHGHEWC